MAARPKATEHDHRPGGTRLRAVPTSSASARQAGMSEYSGLYYARPGANGGAERELVRGVCYCCKTALEVASGGQIFAGANSVLTFGDAVALDAGAPGVYPVMAAVGGGLVIARVKDVKDAAVIAVSRQ